jgi:hypothetical protein
MNELLLDLIPGIHHNVLCQMILLRITPEHILVLRSFVGPRAAESYGALIMPLKTDLIQRTSLQN